MSGLNRLVGLLTAAWLFCTPLCAQQEPVKNFSFRRLVGGHGEKEVSDFRGRVLLAVWYQDVFSGMAAAEQAVKLARKYDGKGLSVVLISNVKWKDKSGAEQRAFLHKRFKDHRAMVAPKIRVPMAFKGDAPHYFIVGADGALVQKGAYKTSGGEIPGLVKKALAARKKGWGDNGTQKKVRQTGFVKGQIGAAWTAIGSAKGDALREEIQALFKTRLAMLGRLIDQGRFDLARSEYDTLSKGVADIKLFRESLPGIAEKLDSESGQAAVKAAKSIEKVAASIRKGKGGKSAIKKLEKLASACEEKAVAGRVRELVAVARAMD